MKLGKMNESGQGAVGIIISLGVLLVVAVIGLMIYNQMFGALAFGSNATGVSGAVATLNLVNGTFLPLVILVAAAVSILAIVVSLRGR